MKLSGYLVSGFICALIATGAQAGTMDMFYNGSDPAASIEVDGVSYGIGSSDGWVTATHIEPGAHKLAFHAHGRTATSDLVLSVKDAYLTQGPDAPAWCLNVKDSTYAIVGIDDCELMMSAAMGGDPDEGP